ncbi:aspartyl protease family protein [bacterium]|nr:aspartyl protease family protein [candidate division CSSED10-310 bacterium]
MTAIKDKWVYTFIFLISLGMTAGVYSAVPELFELHREAVGGEQAIRNLRTAHLQWQITMMMIQGQVDEWYEAPDKHFIRITTPVVSLQEGYNSDISWRIDQNDQLTSKERDPDEIESDEEIIPLFHYLFPRQSISIEDCGTQVRDGKIYAVLKITNAKGSTRTLYLDPQTNLVSIEEGEEDGIEVTTIYADYKPVDGMMIAHSFSQQAKLAGMPMTIFNLESIAFNTNPEGDIFELPKTVQKDSRFPKGHHSVDVPLLLKGEHFFVSAKVNDTGPYTFLLDSGAGTTILDQEIAEMLSLDIKEGMHALGIGGLRSLGATTIESLDIGDFGIKELKIYTSDLSFLSKAFASPVKGVLGYDLLVRCVVKIDPLGKQMTLIDPKSFDYEGSGSIVEGEITANLINIPGILDGDKEGLFRIDTGAGGGVHLHGPFVLKHNLQDTYHPQYTVTTSGVGGDQESILTRAGSLTLGKYTIEGPLATLNVSEDTGALSMMDSIGTIGNGVLQKFVIFFDYSRNRMILEPNAKFPERMHLNHAGFFLIESNNIKKVYKVFPGSPAAAAGIQSGDIILKINKLDAENVSTEQIRAMLNGPVGTELKFKFQRDTEMMTIKLKLAEYL